MKKVVFLLAYLFLISCGKVELFEKTISIPTQEWKSTFKPSFIFNMPDTLQTYNIYFFIRHRTLYEYNNLWINLFIKNNIQPKTDTLKYELTLGNNNLGWLGNRLGDVVDQYILLTPTPVRFYKGENEISIMQIMRQDPLKYILNVGLRVEPSK
ncbi:MAG: gliding motility lipoprotein GldH [Chitinophagaceae bacterium]